jgi:hypothetical protein
MSRPIVSPVPDLNRNSTQRHYGAKRGAHASTQFRGAGVYNRRRTLRRRGLRLSAQPAVPSSTSGNSISAACRRPDRSRAFLPHMALCSLRPVYDIVG